VEPLQRSETDDMALRWTAVVHTRHVHKWGADAEVWCTIEHSRWTQHHRNIAKHKRAVRPSPLVQSKVARPLAALRWSALESWERWKPRKDVRFDVLFHHEAPVLLPIVEHVVGFEKGARLEVVHNRCETHLVSPHGEEC
jgi:hypothetical protein